MRRARVASGSSGWTSIRRSQCARAASGSPASASAAAASNSASGRSGAIASAAFGLGERRGGIAALAQRGGAQRAGAGVGRIGGEHRVEAGGGGGPVAVRGGDAGAQHQPVGRRRREPVEVVERGAGEVGPVGVEPEPRGVLVDRSPAAGRQRAVGVAGELGQDQRGGAVGAHRLERRASHISASAPPPSRVQIDGLLARGGGVGRDGGLASLGGADLGARGGPRARAASARAAMALCIRGAIP